MYLKRTNWLTPCTQEAVMVNDSDDNGRATATPFSDAFIMNESILGTYSVDSVEDYKGTYNLSEILYGECDKLD